MAECLHEDAERLMAKMRASQRTGSFPLMAMAHDYNLSLETVYGYAEYLRMLLLAKDGDQLPTGYWVNKARKDVWSQPHERASKFADACTAHVGNFLRLQGHIPS